MTGNAFYRGTGNGIIRGTGNARAPGGGVLMHYDCSITDSVTLVGGKIHEIEDQTEYLNHMDDTNEDWPDWINKTVDGGGNVQIPDIQPNSSFDYQEIRDDTLVPPEYDGDAEIWLVNKVEDTGDDQTWFYHFGCPRVRTKNSGGALQTFTLYPWVTAGGQLRYAIEANFPAGSSVWATGDIAAAGTWHTLRITCSESNGWKLWYNDSEQTLSYVQGSTTNLGFHPFKDADPTQTSTYVRFACNAEPGFYSSFQLAEFKILEGIMSTAQATAFHNELTTKWDI